MFPYPTTKRCPACGETKTHSEFYQDAQQTDGLTSRCKVCRKNYQRTYHEKNRDAILEAKRQRYAENIEQERLRTRIWHRANREYIQSRVLAWRKRNPGKAIEYARATRANARLKGNPARRREKRYPDRGTYTLERWRAMLAYFGHVCLCCGYSGELTVDHVVPLSVGGMNTIDNLQPLCMACNQKKATKSIDYRNPDRLAAFLLTT